MKKLLSVILAIVMTLSVFSCVSVYAVEETIVPTTENTTEGDVTEPSTDEPTTDEPTTEPTFEIPEALRSFNTTNDVNGVSLSWAAVEGAESYNIYRRAAGEAEPTLIKESFTETTFVDETVESSVYYKYTISAVNAAGESDACEGALIRYIASPKLTSIENVNGGIKINWSVVAGAKAYRVYRRGAGATAWYYLGTVTKTTFTDTAIKNYSGNYYRYTVRAENGYYSGFDVSGLYIKYIGTPKLTSVANANGGVTVKWASVKGATGYRVYRRAAGESWSFITTVKTLTYTDSAAVNGKYYRYTVRAVSGTTFSGFITDGPLVKCVATPKMVSVTNTTNGVNVKWQTVSGASDYRVYRRGAGETNWTYLTTTKSNTYKDTGCIPLKYYRYTVRAVSGGYYSGFEAGLVLKFIPTGTWDKATTYNLYKNVANTYKGSLDKGYTYKNWQNVKSQSVTGDNKELVNEFRNAMNSTFYKASDPFVYKCAAYSEEADLLFPGCTAALKNVKSATCKKSGKNYTVTLVMADEISPEKNKTGISAISNNYFGAANVIDMYKQEGLITSGSAKSVYKNFTITAVITPEGKLVSMTHSCKDVTIDMNMNFVSGFGNLRYKATIDTYETFTF